MTGIHYPVVRPDLYFSQSSSERMLDPIFSREQVEHAVKVAPRIKGVFETAYQAPHLLSHYKVIADVEIKLANFANPEIKLQRLQIAEAALDIHDYLKGLEMNDEETVSQDASDKIKVEPQEGEELRIFNGFYFDEFGRLWEK